jgi:hypothetical protein
MSKLAQRQALGARQYEERLAKAKVNNAATKAPPPVINRTPVAELQALTDAVPVKSSAQRQAKWRQANPDTNKQRAKDGMRKRRVKDGK